MEMLRLGDEKGIVFDWEMKWRKERKYFGWDTETECTLNYARLT